MRQQQRQRQQREQRPRRMLKHYDTLKLESKEDTFSKWSGERGTYIFKSVGSSPNNQRSPIRQVYLNREYLSGLFKTKNESEFSADAKDTFTGERVYLLFRVTAPDSIDILQKC